MSQARIQCETTVVSVRGRVPAELLRDPAFLYVGRQCAGWPRSLWANPFKPDTTATQALAIMAKTADGERRSVSTEKGDSTRMAAFMKAGPVDRYEHYVRSRRSLWSAIPELIGLRLGCWCCNWNPGDSIDDDCHAVVLARLAAEAVRLADEGRPWPC